MELEEIARKYEMPIENVKKLYQEAVVFVREKFPQVTDQKELQTRATQKLLIDLQKMRFAQGELMRAYVIGKGSEFDGNKKVIAGAIERGSVTQPGQFICSRCLKVLEQGEKCDRHPNTEPEMAELGLPVDFRENSFTKGHVLTPRIVKPLYLLTESGEFLVSYLSPEMVNGISEETAITFYGRRNENIVNISQILNKEHTKIPSNILNPVSLYDLDSTVGTSNYTIQIVEGYVSRIIPAKRRDGSVVYGYELVDVSSPEPVRAIAWFEPLVEPPYEQYSKVIVIGSVSRSKANSDFSDEKGDLVINVRGVIGVEGFAIPRQGYEFEESGIVAPPLENEVVETEVVPTETVPTKPDTEVKTETPESTQEKPAENPPEKPKPEPEKEPKKTESNDIDEWW